MTERSQFDTITRRLTTETSRREIFAGVLGCRSAPRRDDGRRASEERRQQQGQEQAEVAICHYDKETGLYSFLQIPTTALKGHQKHTSDVGTDVTSADDCEALNAALLEPVPDPGLG